MISPRLEAAVSGERALAVASLEVGSVRRAATMAMTRSRQRLPSGPRMRSSPIWRSVPRTAATWPWGSAANGEHLRGGWGRNDGSALEQGLEGFKETGGPVGEVAQRAFLDLSTLAIGLAQEDGGRRAAVGDHLDEHAHPECHEPPPLTRTRTQFTCLQPRRRTTGIRAISITCAYRKQEARTRVGPGRPSRPPGAGSGARKRASKPQRSDRSPRPALSRSSLR